MGNKKGDKKLEDHLISRAELWIQIINDCIYFYYKPFHSNLRNINLPEWEIRPRQETYINNITSWQGVFYRYFWSITDSHKPFVFSRLWVIFWAVTHKHLFQLKNRSKYLISHRFPKYFRVISKDQNVFGLWVFYRKSLSPRQFLMVTK